MREIPRITVAEAKRLMDLGETVQFVDSRNPTAWAQSDRELPGAVRVPADEIEQHLAELPRDRTLVAYCT